jgi:hypothetical protein
MAGGWGGSLPFETALKGHDKLERGTALRHIILLHQSVHCTYVRTRKESLAQHFAINAVTVRLKLNETLTLNTGHFFRDGSVPSVTRKGTIREIRHLNFKTSVFSKSNVILYVMFKSMTFHYTLCILLINQENALHNVIECTNIKCTYRL